jgi:hypothetical protein
VFWPDALWILALLLERCWYSTPRIHIHKNRVAQLNPWTLGSSHVTFHDTQGYGGDILTLLHTGLRNPEDGGDMFSETSARTRAARYNVPGGIYNSYDRVLRSQDTKLQRNFTLTERCRCCHLLSRTIASFGKSHRWQADAWLLSLIRQR